MFVPIAVHLFVATAVHLPVPTAVHLPVPTAVHMFVPTAVHMFGVAAVEYTSCVVQSMSPNPLVHLLIFVFPQAASERGFRIAIVV